MNLQEPLPRGTAALAVARCMGTTAPLLARGRVSLPRQKVGAHLRFADGTSGRVFRETLVEREPPEEPCLLVVEFRLRLLHGRLHALFLWECILNTPLFVGFPGFVSKLWLDRDEQDRYRGLYEWDDPAGAQFYARALWRVLELVSPRDSIHYRVVPGVRRDDVLRDPHVLDQVDSETAPEWWRVVATTP